MVVIFRPMSSSAGECPQASGVDLYANSPLVGSFSFFKRDLVVLRARSTSPFACGKRGLLVVCLNPQSFANWVNSADAYCGPLSLLTSSGMPCHAKIALSALITSDDLVVLFIAATSTYSTAQK